MNLLTKWLTAGLLSLVSATAQAATVNFNGSATNTSLTSFSSGGLTFTPSLAGQLIIYDSRAPGSNGTDAMLFAGRSTSSTLTITRTGGGLFDLISIDMALSFSVILPQEVLINDTGYMLTRSIATLTPGLRGVSSVSISMISGGYWLADNVVYSPVASVPLPGGAPLILTGLAAFGLLRRRKG